MICTMTIIQEAKFTERENTFSCQTSLKYFFLFDGIQKA